jgi:hypothetical protein
VIRFRVMPLLFPLLSFPLLTSAAAYGQNPLLRELAKEDQDYRRGKKVERTDEERIKLVLAQIAQGAVKTPEDQFNAASCWNTPL